MKFEDDDKMCTEPCDTCGGSMTNKECREMAGKHCFPFLCLLVILIFIILLSIFN